MSVHDIWFLIFFLMLLDWNKRPREPKPPKADDLFFGRERRAAAEAESRARRAAAVRRRRQMVASWFRGRRADQLPG